MTGTFILSFDCEGRWGVADLPAARSPLLSDDHLRAAYSEIFRILREFEIQATFAAVDLFIQPDRVLQSLDHDGIARRLPYTRHAMAELSQGKLDGWSAPWLLDQIGDAHELASHGVTHSPFDALSADDVDFEFSLVENPVGRTFIFPRNAVAHQDKLIERGYLGWRACRSASALTRLANEAWPIIRSDPRTQPDETGHVVIPAGRFINWRAGARRAIPPGLTAIRARSLLNHASRTEQVGHFWTHPENMAMAPDSLVNLRNICRIAAEMRDAGKLQVQTQIDYVRAEANRASPGIVG